MRAGFTIIEILVASVIGTFVAVVAVGMLQAVSISSERAQAYVDGASELGYAADLIRDDLRNMHRRIDTERGTIIWQPGQDVPGGSLSFYTVSLTRAREHLPESDVYQVEYSLRPDGEQAVLSRRVWPNPNEYYEPGGILSVIARDVVAFEVEFYDGSQWHDQWDPADAEMPAMMSVMLAGDSGSASVRQESFIVKLPRMAEDQNQSQPQQMNRR